MGQYGRMWKLQAFGQMGFCFCATCDLTDTSLLPISGHRGTPWILTPLLTGGTGVAGLASLCAIPVAEECGSWPVRNCRQWGRRSLSGLGSLCANVHMHVAVFKYVCAGKCTSVDVLCAVSAASTHEKEPKVGWRVPCAISFSPAALEPKATETHLWPAPLHPRRSRSSSSWGGKCSGQALHPRTGDPPTASHQFLKAVGTSMDLTPLLVSPRPGLQLWIPSGATVSPARHARAW